MGALAPQSWAGVGQGGASGGAALRPGEPASQPAPASPLAWVPEARSQREAVSVVVVAVRGRGAGVWGGRAPTAAARCARASGSAG